MEFVGSSEEACKPPQAGTDLPTSLREETGGCGRKGRGFKTGDITEADILKIQGLQNS